MKIVEMFVKMKVPETLAECNDLRNSHGNCPMCAYNFENIVQPCRHHAILRACESIKPLQNAVKKPIDAKREQSVRGNDAKCESCATWTEYVALHSYITISEAMNIYAFCKAGDMSKERVAECLNNGLCDRLLRGRE